MDRAEFIERLQRALAGGLNSAQVAENIRYYQEYIDSEYGRGRDEAEILAQLGDPRLLAKSIIEANKRAGTSYDPDRAYDEEAFSGQPAQDADDGAIQGRRIMLPGWLVMLIVAVAGILIIGLATALISYFAPVILVALTVILIVKVVQSGRRR